MTPQTPRPLPADARWALEQGHEIMVRTGTGMNIQDTIVKNQDIEAAWSALFANDPHAQVVAVGPPGEGQTRGERGDPTPPEVQQALDEGWGMIVDVLESIDPDAFDGRILLNPDEVEQFWRSEAPHMTKADPVKIGTMAELKTWSEEPWRR